MFTYLEKFNSLPQELKDKINAPAVVFGIEELEWKYGIQLASFVMQVMTKDININGIEKYLTEELGLDSAQAEMLKGELVEKIFKGVADYLGISILPKINASNEGNPPSPLYPIKFSQSEFNGVNQGGNINTDLTPPSPSQGEGVNAQAGSTQSMEPAAEKNEAAFFFVPEDEEEIRKFSDETPATSLSMNELIDEKMEAVIKASQISFSSELMADRFRNILGTYFRGIRDKIGTKQTLKKSFASGGLGLAVDVADKIMGFASGEVRMKKELPKQNANNNEGNPPNPLYQGGKNAILQGEGADAQVSPPYEGGVRGSFGDKQMKALKDSGVRDVDYVFESKSKVQQKEDLTPPSPSQGEGAIPHYPPPYEGGARGGLSSGEVNAQGGSTQSMGPTKGQSSIRPSLPPIFLRQDIKQSRVITRPKEIPGKPRMEDIKYIPRVVTPVDELKNLDLLNFRRLDQDPFKAVAKIRGKIELLEEEDYAKRLSGIKSWRLSPVNSLYLEIGKDSIGKGKPIDAIIEERRIAKKEYLTGQELEAIGQLNRELRF